MSSSNDPAADLRAMSPAELEQLGADSLRSHLAAQAVVAHHKHAPLTWPKIETFLADRECVRHPTRVVFEFGEMAPHQFAQPELDPRDAEGLSRVLYLRPLLRNRPDWAVLAVAYLVPVINYGEIITDDLCVLYGATLLGLMEEEFYSRVCEMADAIGSEARLPEGPTPPSCPGQP